MQLVDIRENVTLTQCFCPHQGLSIDQTEPCLYDGLLNLGRMSERASTTSFSVANSTFTFSIPTRLLTAFSILRAQLGQSIPFTCQLKRWLPAGVALASLSLSSSPSSVWLLRLQHPPPGVNAHSLNSSCHD